MKTILLLFVTILFSIKLFASDEPVDLKIELDNPIEVKSGKDNSQIQMWVSIGCAIITLMGTATVALVSRNTALKTIEKQSKKSFDLQNRQHFLNILRESIVEYLSIASKTLIAPRSEKELIPDENFTSIVSAQTNLILMLNPDKKENDELITEIRTLTRLTCSSKPEEISSAPAQYFKLELLLRKLLTNKWERIKAS